MARRILRFLQIGGRFGLPLVFVVLFGLMAYDQRYPWSLADELVPVRAGQTRLLVGAGYSSRSSYAASGQVSERTADYAYYPEVFKTREMYMLSHRSGQDPSVSAYPFGPVSYVAGLLVALALSVVAWWFPLARRA